MADTTGRQATPDLRPAVPPPELDDPAKEENRPGGWDWAAQTDTTAVYLADTVDCFVAYFNGRYPWTREQTIPPCWAQHGALIEEITTLMSCGPDGPPSKGRWPVPKPPKPGTPTTCPSSPPASPPGSDTKPSPTAAPGTTKPHASSTPTGPS